MSRLPRTYAPQFASLVKAPPEGAQWLHEMKYDGYRIGCRIDRGAVTLLSRHGKDWTPAFPEIVEAARKLRLHRALLDGEVAALTSDGRTSFQDLQNSVSGGSRRGLLYFVFDLLHIDDEDLTALPLDARKARLATIRGIGPRGRIRLSEHVEGRGRDVFAHACRLGAEGLVSKRRDAPYRPGRHGEWVKTKCVSSWRRSSSPSGRTTAKSVIRRSRGCAATKHRARSPANGRGPADGQRDRYGARPQPVRRLPVETVAGIRITHADRVVFPDADITKAGLAKYYERIADWILPHLEDRPLTLVRCPEGTSGDCFYMKHSNVWAPEDLRRVRIREKTKIGQYLIADTLPALVSLVQMGVLEIHTWNSRFARVEQPDRLVFDIDPGPEVAWPEVIEASRLVRRVLHAIDLDSFVKTTGGRGLHVVVPLRPERDWSECLAFARAVAERLAGDDPTRLTTAFAKAGREGKILIDYLRNNRTNTSVAAFSTRRRTPAPVSVPLAWAELSRDRPPDRLTVPAVLRRLAGRPPDPWKAYWALRQRITSSAFGAIVGRS